MKRKQQQLTHGNQVVFKRSDRYDKGNTHTIISTVATCGVAKTNERHRRIFKMRGIDGDVRFGAEHELRLATRAERY